MAPKRGVAGEGSVKLSLACRGLRGSHILQSLFARKLPGCGRLPLEMEDQPYNDAQEWKVFQFSTIAGLCNKHLAPIPGSVPKATAWQTMAGLRRTPSHVGSAHEGSTCAVGSMCLSSMFVYGKLNMESYTSRPVARRAKIGSTQQFLPLKLEPGCPTCTSAGPEK